MATVKSTSEDKKWEAEDAARALMRAEEIKRDKNLYKRALTEVKRRQQEASNLLKVHGSNMD